MKNDKCKNGSRPQPLNKQFQIKITESQQEHIFKMAEKNKTTAPRWVRGVLFGG